MPVERDRSPFHARSGAAQLEILRAPGENGPWREARVGGSRGDIGVLIGPWIENAANLPYGLEAEKRFRRVKGHREMPQLLNALEVLVKNNVLDTKEEVA